MDTLNDVMNDLLIDQDDRLDDVIFPKGSSYLIEAKKAEKIILDGVEDTNASKN